MLSVAATNALFTYLLDTQKNNLEHINKIVLYSVTKYMSLDINARRNSRNNRKTKR